MDRIKLITRLALSLLLLQCLYSCTANFDHINRNPNEVDEGQLEVDNYNVGSKITALQGMVVSTQEHLYQFYDLMVGGAYGGYVSETPNGWLNKYSTFNPELAWQKAPFMTTMTDTYPSYRAILSDTDDVVPLALAKILRVAIMHRLTDTYGPIPYSKVIDPTNPSLTVAYDSQEEVYMKMFEELDEAWNDLNDNSYLPTDAFGKFDAVYGGDLNKWMKYCASLQLRMAMRLTHVDPKLAKDMAEDAVIKGVITDNADNAYLTVTTNNSALCWNDWNDHRVSADLTCYMNGYNDPRRASMFTSTGTDKDGNILYKGLRRSIFPYDKDQAAKQTSSSTVDASSPYLWMNAAEVTFLRAEGALNGWSMGGEAEELYNSAITLSFEEHNVGKEAAAYIADAVSKPEEHPATHFGASAPAPSNITIKWVDGNSDAVKEQNLQRIITQKWIAIFPLGLEAWAEYRRTGYPEMIPAEENLSGGSVNSTHGARRLNYPVDEYIENGENVQAAVQNYLDGDDNLGTRLWWDKRPLN